MLRVEDADSEEKPRSAECKSGPFFFGSNMGSDLPVLLAAFSGLNDVESTDHFKANSRMLYH
jgi:hypothetical protein